MPSINIRKLEKKDAEAVEKIFDLYWSDEFRTNLSEKLKDFINNSVVLTEQDFQFFVAERDSEIVGVSAIRKLPERMKIYAKTKNPAEFYVLAVKYKHQGIGKILRLKRIEEARKLGYTEIILFSGEKHQDSWGFHDKSEFKRINDSIAPNGEKGYIWQMIL